MTILAAATLDYIQFLKSHSSGWSFEPLIVTSDDPLRHQQFVTVKGRSNHVSPTQHYIDNPPTGVATLVKARTKGHYPRIIEIRLAPGPVAKLHLVYWRANGWRQNEISHKRSYSRKYAPVQQRGETSFKVYATERITKRKSKKGHSLIHRDVIDLTAEESTNAVAKMTMLTLDKSLQKAHGAGRQKLSTWGQHMAVVLDGTNFMYDNYGWWGIRSEVVYG
jgi:hypothetical protein